MVNMVASELMDFLESCDNSKISCYIEGRSGIGKSEIVKQYAIQKSKKLKKPFSDGLWKKGHFCFVDVRGSQLSSVDTRGVPYIEECGDNQKITKWGFPIWIPNAQNDENEDYEGILFLDEINQAFADTQHAFFQLVRDRQLGEIKISPKVFIVSAGNTNADNQNLTEMSLALNRRFVHSDLICNSKEWIDLYAIPNNMNSFIINYISQFPNDLLEENSDNKDRSQPCPRTWKYANDLISPIMEKLFSEEMTNRERDMLYMKLEKYTNACIGSSVSSKFMKFVKLSGKFNVGDILKNPKKAEEIKGFDDMYALISAINEKYKIEKNNLSSCIEVVPYIQNAEFSAALLKMLKSVNEEKFAKMIENDKNRKLIDIIMPFAKYWKSV